MVDEDELLNETPADEEPETGNSTDPEPTPEPDPDVVTVKAFLRLDTDEDISLYLDAAKQYFKDAVGADYDRTKPREVYALCAITQELYDHRTMIVDDPSKDRLRHVISSILDHIRLDMIPEDGDDDES